MGEEIIYRKAITVKEISGNCIKTIPIGTGFEVAVHKHRNGYRSCRGLGITSIFNDEFEFVDVEKEVG